MKRTKVTSQYRRDVWFTATCEGCNHTQTNISGYDDHFFWNDVLPDMKCEKCKKSTNSLGEEAEFITPKVPPGITI